MKQLKLLKLLRTKQMKKTLLFISIILILVSNINAQELIANGGFESWTSSELNNWTYEWDITLSEETSIFHSEAKSCKVAFISKDPGDTDFRQSINLVAGVKYNVSLWVYHLDNKAKVRIYSAGVWTSVYSNSALLNQWQKISYEFTATTSGTAEFGMRFYDETTWSNPALVCIDDFSVPPAITSAPQITNIVTNPSKPTPSDAVSISASISDDVAISKAFLLWSLNGVNFNDSIEMSGTNGTFTTISTIPPQSIGSIVYYKIRATNSNSKQSLSITQSYNLSILEAGDIAFLQYKFDSPDAFSFLLLKDLPANYVVTFTDNAWNGSSLSTNEGNITWTTPTGGISAGTIVTYDSLGIMSYGTALTSSAFALAYTGEAIFVYTGTSENPTFISAISTLPWLTTGVVNSSTSYLPNSLIEGFSAISFSLEWDNGYYSNTNISGSKTEILNSIYNETNWLFDDNPTKVKFKESSYWTVVLSSENINFSDEILIYPNPFSDFLTIDSKIKITEISISNILGQNIESFEISNNISKLNLENLKPGLYFIRLMNENEIIETIKIVKK